MSFYYSYIPVHGITVPVHLHFDHAAPACFPSPQVEGGRAGKWPYGVADVSGLVSRQKYDVVVEMDVPRSESNVKAGNWMVGLDMRGPAAAGGSAKSMLGWEEDWDVEDRTRVEEADASAEATPGKPPIIAKSRRSALLNYRSRPAELVSQLLRLPLYLIGWQTEFERIEIPMMEAVEFSKDARNTPSSLRLELRSRYPIDVYRVRVQFIAKFEGLRWLMYRYRLTSLVIFTTLFWGVEMGLVLLTWIFLTLLVSKTPSPEDYEQTKPEAVTPKREADTEPGTPFSDTSRTFPTLSSHKPLHYSSPNEGKIKKEHETRSLDDIPTREEAEADDEDDDFVLEEPVPLRREGGFEDSGIGTSFESGMERERGLQRRRGGSVSVSASASGSGRRRIKGEDDG